MDDEEWLELPDEDRETREFAGDSPVSEVAGDSRAAGEAMPRPPEPVELVSGVELEPVQASAGEQAAATQDDADAPPDTPSDRRESPPPAEIEIDLGEAEESTGFEIAVPAPSSGRAAGGAYELPLEGVGAADRESDPLAKIFPMLGDEASNARIRGPNDQPAGGNSERPSQAYPPLHLTVMLADVRAIFDEALNAAAERLGPKFREQAKQEAESAVWFYDCVRQAAF